MRNTFCSLIAALFAGLGAFVAAAAPALAAPPPKPEVAVLRLDGDVTVEAARAFVKKLEEALAKEPRFVIVELDAMSSDLDAIHYVTAALARVRRPAETVAYVTGHVSGAVPLIVFSCDHVAMAPRSTVGECGQAASAELANELAQAAASHGYPEAIAAAMGGRTGAIFHVAVEPPNGEGAPIDEFVSDAKIQTWPAEKQRRILMRMKLEEFLERLDPQAAKRLGVARWVAEDRSDLVGELETLARSSLVVREADGLPSSGGFDGALAWLARKGLLPFFLFLGLLGIAIEISHPSLVFPGVLGVIFLAVALSGGHLAGLTSAFDLCLIVGGIVLLILEMFVLPGFGAPGIIGIICVLLGAFLAFQESPWPTNETQMAEWRAGAKTFAVGIAGTMVAFAVIARLLPQSPVLKRLVHSSTQRVEDGYTVAPSTRVAFVGRAGTASTDLRPSGKVEIDGEIVDATSDGTWISKGTSVEVIETSENRLVVKQKNPTA